MTYISHDINMELDKTSSVPLYQQLGSIMREHIKKGIWAEGTQIPTELDLSKTYSTSRVTVRAAINELVEDNLLIRRQGKGTYVALVSLKKSPKEFSSFTETCIRMNRKAGSILIASDTKIATQKQADFFKLAKDDNKNIIRIKRVRLVDDVAVILETVYFPLSFSFLFCEQLEGSLYEILKRHRIIPSKITRDIDVCVANEEEIKLLKVERDTPLLLVEDYALSESDSPIHISKQAIRSDLFKYSLELER